MGLKGPVKLMITNYFSRIPRYCRCISYSFFNTKGQLTEERLYYPKTRLVHDSELTWLTYMEDINGEYTGLDTNYFMLSHKDLYTYSESNKKKIYKRIKAGGIVSFEEVYVYNEKDSLIKQIYYRMDENGKCEDTSITQFNYNHNNNIVIQTKISSESDTTIEIFTFEKGKIKLKENLWKVANKFHRDKREFRYDKKGNRLETLYFFYDEENNYKLIRHEIRTYKRQKLATLIDSSSYDFTKFRFYYKSKGKILIKDENSIGSKSKSTTFFDKYDNIIQENHEWHYVGELTQQQSQSQTKYQYDAYGNWISEELNVIENNSSEIKISNRRFEYYNL